MLASSSQQPAMDGLSPFNFFNDDASFDFHRQLGGGHGDGLSLHTPPSAAQLQALLHHSPASLPPALSPQDLHQLFAQQHALQQAQQVFHLQQQQLPPQPSQHLQQQRPPPPPPSQVPAPQPSFSSRAEEAVSSLLRAGEATRKRQKFQRSRLGWYVLLVLVSIAQMQDRADPALSQPDLQVAEAQGPSAGVPALAVGLVR